MENALKDSGRRGSFTVKVSKLFLMALSSMGIGKRVDLSDRACASTLMAQNTQEAG